MTVRTPDEIVGMFLDLETSYSARKLRLQGYEDFFTGDHWVRDEAAEDETSFQLVFNYCRAVVLKYSAILAQAPKFRISVETDDVAETGKARKREALLQSYWKDLYKAWRDVEVNAAKKTFGVLQILWAPPKDEPKEVTIGYGGDEQKRQRYTANPFKFRSIEPELFYPVYRTFDTPDDFLYVIRFDPDRLVEDIEETYGVSLQGTSLAGGGLESMVGVEVSCDLIEYWDKDHYKLVARTKRTQVTRQGTYSEYGAITLKEYKHDCGRIPFWVVQNLRNPGSDPADLGSLGDIDSIAKLNQHYNLIQSEAAEEIVTNIHRPVAYKSDDHKQDPTQLTMAPGAVYPIGAEEELVPLEWPPMPQAVENHLLSIMKSIQDLSFVGEAGFGAYPPGATGVGLKMITQSLEQILMLKIPLRIEVLESVVEYLFKYTEHKLEAKKPAAGGTVPPPMPGAVSPAGQLPQGEAVPAVTKTPAMVTDTTPKSPEGLALQLWIKGKTGRFNKLELTARDIGANYYVNIDYGNLLPRNEIEYQQNEVYKLKTGVQSLWTTLDNIGVDSPDDEIARIKREKQDPILNTEAVLMQLQLKQQMQPPQPPMPAGPAAPPGGGGMPPAGAPPQGGPSMNAAPPVPAMPGNMGGPANPMGGAGAPYMQRAPGPNPSQVSGPRPGINTGAKPNG